MKGRRLMSGTSMYASEARLWQATAFLAVASLLGVGLVAVPSSAVADEQGVHAPDPGVSVDGETVERLEPSPVKEPAKVDAGGTERPAGGSGVVPVRSAARTTTKADAAKARTAAVVGAEQTDVGGLPIAAVRADGAPLDDVAVEVVAPASDRTGPVALIGLSAPASRLDAAVGADRSGDGVRTGSVVDLAVDYSGFAGLYGGSWDDRLTMVQVPACALDTPQKSACQTTMPLKVVNRSGEDVLVVQGVTVAGGSEPAVLALMADESGKTGTFGATPLAPAGTWSTDLRSGSFSWNYPVGVPDVPGSFTPTLGLSYSSGGIDGRTSSTNNQGSLVGDGFDLWPGYIERKYKSCAMDDVKNDAGRPVGDLCWDYDNAFISFNGAAGELVPIGTDTWRLGKDDGTKIERLYGTSRANGDADQEYWKVTTPNGTQYFFGYHRMPGWEAGDPVSHSVFTVPVLGDDAGDQCHEATRATSVCVQGWRWNLDYAVDTAGNKITYTYAKEVNSYGKLGDPAADTAYVRGGTLSQIAYGYTGSDLVGTGADQALARVSFDYSQRCIPGAVAGFGCTSISTQPNGWFDTPWDLNCASGSTCDGGRTSPSFWTRQRLTGISTAVFAGSSAAWKSVDSWTFGHRWGTSDTDYQLLLTDVTRTGHTGPADSADGPANISLPTVRFEYTQRENRMDLTGDGQAPYVKERLSTVVDEVGGQVDVAYSAPACQAAALPVPETNTTRCFPQKRKPGPELAPVTDWFNKYVTTSVTTTDRTGQAPDSVTSYAYLGGGAWHWDESTGMVPAEEKTWSDWRGYGQVRVTTGGEGAPKSQTDHWFLRGMHGDRATASGGTTTKQVGLGEGEGAAIYDQEYWAGFAYKTATYSGPDGAVVSKTVNRPWWHQTGISERAWGDIRSGFTGTSTTKTWTSLGTGGSPWRTTEQFNSFDTVAGRITQVDDRGDTSTTSDDRCSNTTYATNTTKNILGLHSRQETWAVGCSATPDRPGGQVISDTRYAYDTQGYGVAPSVGQLTGTADLASYEGTTAKYVEAIARFDRYGRPTSVTDVNATLTAPSYGAGVLSRVARSDGHTTTTAYSPATGFATSMVETGPPANPGDATTSLKNTTTLDPTRGVPTKVVDANSNATNVAYDALGRTSKVWLADRAVNQTPSTVFTYDITGTRAPAVGTTVLNDNGDQRTSWTIYDGLLRQIQTQDPGQDGGMILADTHYDARGLVERTYNAYYTTAATGGRLFDPYEKALVDGQVRNTYDGLGRPTASKLMRNDGDGGELLATTRTVYRGDRTTVIPPVGGTATTSVTDARGQVVQLRQHHNRASASPEDTTGFDTTRYGYSPRGELAAVVDPKSNRWEYTYDQRGRQVRTLDPDSGVTTSVYDVFGRVVSTTNAEDQTLVNLYDGLGRQTELRGGTATGALRASWTYDTVPGAKGQLASATRYEGGQPYTTKVTVYDKLYRPQRQQVVIPAVEGKLAGTYLTGTTYAPNGQVIGQGLPAAGALPGQTIAYVMDPDTGLVTGTAGPNGIGATVAYDNVGRATHYEMHAGVSELITATYSYDRTTDRLLGYQADRFSRPGIDRSETYEYDEAGNVTSLADVSRTGTDTQCFDYDYLARLTGAWTQTTADCATTGQAAETAGTIGGPAPYWHEYSYDKVGSRLTEVRNGIAGSSTPGDVTRTYEYDPAQPHTATGVVQHTAAAGGNPEVTASESYTYNAVGQTTQRVLGGDTQTLSWTPEGRVDQVANADGTGSEYLYDADGNRLISRDTVMDGATGEPVTETTLYLGHTEVTVRETEPMVARATRYVDVGGGHFAVIEDSGAVTFNLADHQGTGQLSISASDMALTQRRTAPFGTDRGKAVAPSDWAGSRGFVGGYDDGATTGLVSLGAREYDPALGRFISLDPVMDLTDPQQIHGYSYASNSPVTVSDPTGLLEWDNGAPGSAPPPASIERARDGGNCYQNCLEAGSSRGPGVTVGDGGGSATNTGSPGAASEGPTRDEIADARAIMDKSVTDVALEMGWELLKDFVGWNDLQGCLNSDIMSCGMLAMGITPWGKGLKAVKVLYKMIDGAMAFYKKQKSARKILDQAGAACTIDNSFTPGTLVLLADGTSKPIEEIELGDEVLAMDEGGGKSQAQPVTALISGTGAKDLVTITLAGDGGGSLVATDGHPFWAPALDAWVDAGDLKVGQWLRTSAGSLVQIEQVEHETRVQPVHNLTVANGHTYYVLAGEAPVLVHNCGSGSISDKVMGEHILPRHDANHADSWKWAEKSKFEDWVTPDHIRNWSKLAMRKPMDNMNLGTGSAHRHIFDIRSRHPIGYDADGNDLFSVAVWVRNSAVESVHPN